MTDQRKAELLDQIIGWLAECGGQILVDGIDSTDITDDELVELDLGEFFELT